jgi:hypothetical protein
MPLIGWVSAAFIIWTITWYSGSLSQNWERAGVRAFIEFKNLQFKIS